MIKKTFQFGRISLIRVIFYKPCFVQSSYREQLNLDNHLSAISCLFGSVLYLSVPKSAPTIVWVARSRGLPRSTDKISPIASSLWHFQGYSSIANALAFFPAVTLLYSGLWFRQTRTLQASQLVRAWTFLSLHLVDRDYLKITLFSLYFIDYRFND